MTPTSQAPTAIDEAPGFTGRCVETQRFEQPVGEVYRRLHDVAAWPQFLPHVESIEVLYDDGRYQEFLMTVASENDLVLKVRSVRNCREGLIEFFQPDPPPYLAHHGGVWRFAESQDGACEVTVTHVWNQNERAAEFFPEGPEGSTEEQVCALLAGHSRLALNRWAHVLGTPTAEAGA